MQRLCAGSLAVWLAAATFGCSDTNGLGRQGHAVVYEADDRQEFFELSDPGLRAVIEQSTVALIPRDRMTASGGIESALSLGDAADLCPGEPYADQPALALCTGVLVDFDLVLTAGHCVRALPIDELYVVFDYFYAEPGKLAVHGGSVFEPLQIVAERLSRPEDPVRFDYAWLRLAQAMPYPRQPLGIRVRPAEAGEPLTAVGAALSVPLKADAGGRVQQARADSRDYFVANTDTSGGASGGPALDADLALLGNLARGEADLERTDAGCFRMRRIDEGAAALEQFTYASRALEELCLTDPGASSLCRSDCGSVCTALPPGAPSAPHACSMTISAPQHAPWSLAWFVVLAAFAARLRKAER
jgi:hypothetical protein